MLGLPELHMRAALFRLIRSFFDDQGFLEVDTPLRQPIFIPENTIVPLAAEGQYLQTSPELCMKRLLARGCEKIFQICPCFRKGEIGRLHLEEFTMLEWYRSRADYQDLMSDCEDLLRFIAQNMGSAVSSCSENDHQKLFPKTDIVSDWQKMSVAEAFELFSPVPLADALEKDQFDELLVEYIEPHLGFGVPLFLYDYPVELGSLAKRNDNNPKVVERFELYINGVELANGFSELTDTEEQRGRFIEEIAVMEKDGRSGVKIPEQFLDDLQRLDTAAGIALGVDRLFMLLMNFDGLSKAVTFHPEDF
jgi:lysyl-tRNA synthetase class 2